MHHLWLVFSCFRLNNWTMASDRNYSILLPQSPRYVGGSKWIGIRLRYSQFSQFLFLLYRVLLLEIIDWLNCFLCSYRNILIQFNLWLSKTCNTIRSTLICASACMGVFCLCYTEIIYCVQWRICERRKLWTLHLFMLFAFLFPFVFCCWLSFRQSSTL